MSGLVVYQPPGSATVAYPKVLARFFGKTQVIDRWQHGDPLPDDALAITSRPCGYALHMRDAVAMLERRRGLAPVPLTVELEALHTALAARLERVRVPTAGRQDLARLFRALDVVATAIERVELGWIDIVDDAEIAALRAMRSAAN